MSESGMRQAMPVAAVTGVLLVIGVVVLLAPSRGPLALTSAVAADKDCGDFSTQAQAQDFFIRNGGPSSDPHGLDADGDGIACESNPCPCSTATGGGGGGGGGSDKPAPDPTIKEKLCGKFRGIPRSRVCVKVILKNGKLKRAKGFKWRGLPARCVGGSKVVTKGKGRQLRESGKRFRSNRPDVAGRARGVRGTISGKVKGNGKKAKGTVRVNFTRPSGAGCTTRARKWKAS